MVGVFVLSLALIPLLSHYSSATENFANIFHRILAINAADEIIQQISLIPLRDFPETQRTFPFPENSQEVSIASSPAATLVVNPLPKPFKLHLSLHKLSPMLASITVTVKWSERAKDRVQRKIHVTDLGFQYWKNSE